MILTRLHRRGPQHRHLKRLIEEGCRVPCCRRSVKHAGKPGPRCRVHKRKSADATEAVEVPSQEEEDVTGVPDAALR